MRNVRKSSLFVSLPNSSFLNRPNGVTFIAAPATTEFSKRWEPKKGDIVSFKHRGYLVGSGKPKLPVLYRMRPDLEWSQVVHHWQEKKHSFQGR